MWALFAGSVYVCEDRWLISLKSLAESKMAPWMAKKTNLTAQPTTNLTCCHSQEAQTNCFAAGRDSSLVLVMSLPSIWKSRVLWSNLPYTCSSLQLAGFCCATAIQLGWRLDLDWAIYVFSLSIVDLLLLLWSLSGCMCQCWPSLSKVQSFISLPWCYNWYGVIRVCLFFSKCYIVHYGQASSLLDI